MYRLKDIKTQFCKTGPTHRLHHFVIISLFAAVLGCISLSVYSQEKGLPFIKNYSPQEYQSHRQNWSIVQGKNGIMYFGNGKGVLEFDGVRWRLITLPNRGHVRSLAAGDDGTIYVGGNRDFGYLGRDEKGLLQFYSLLPKVPEEERDFGRIWSVAVTDQGIYFQSHRRLFLWGDGKIKSWHFDTRLHRIFAFENAFYAMLRGQGLMRLEDDKFEIIPGTEVIKDYKIDVMLPVAKDEYLLGARTNGFYLFNGRSVVKYTSPANEVLKKYGLYKAIYLADSSIAIASNFGAGVIILDKNAGSIKQIIDESTGIANNNVLNIFMDQQNALWIGTQEGIARIDLSTIFSVFDNRLGLDGTIQDVIRHQDTIFAATSVGLYRLETDPDAGYHFAPISDIPSYGWNLFSFEDI